MSHASDRQLITAAQTGDRNALEELLERHQGQVYRFGMQMCRDPDDAKDILQDTLLAMARGVKEFRGEASIATWLYAIARSFCLKKRRKGKFAPSNELSLSDDAMGDAWKLADPGLSPDDAAASQQVNQALQQAIDQLDATYREVLILRDVEGLTASEVASVLGISAEAVKSRVHRARRAVRDQVAPLLKVPADPLPTDEVSPPNCPDVLQLFSQHLEDDISPEACGKMQQHLQQCARCRGTCDSLRDTLALCRATPTARVPKPVEQQVRQAVRNFLAEQQP